MGFAGQVFAARVAVGLAIPSQQALSKAGSMIGGFTARLTKRLHAQRAQAAKQRVAQSTAELSDVRARIQKHQEGFHQVSKRAAKRAIAEIGQKGVGVKIGAAQSLASFTKKAGQAGKMAPEGIKKQWMQSKEAFQSWVGVVKAGNEGLAKSLFDMGKAAAGAEDAQFNVTKFADAYYKLDEKGKKEVMRSTKVLVKAKQNQLEVAKKEMRIVMDSLSLKQAAGIIDDEQLQKAQVRYNEIIQNYEGELSAAKGYYEMVESLGYHYSEELKRWKKDGVVLSKEESDAVTKLNESLKNEEKVLKEIAAATKRAYQAGAQFAAQMKAGFVDSVKGSIAALTAFYYKLNQSTQALIEFEKELMNANSVFNLTRDELYKTGDIVTQFGQQFGISMQNGATGLYQLASAGLSAEASLKVLPETLKLSMAVQGDHNSIAKLTTQTLFGFGMAADEAALLTDKFAYTIQKSLVEYQDLGSAVKFALPFFTATGQSIDQLLGALQVLTNRALEAGIAGRGLRQALSEFAEHAEDNSAAFRKMGLEILNVDGSMKQLNVIAAEYARLIGPEASHNTELLTSMIQDLNVRGATAFIHLVQASDEFTEAVENTRNAGGELDTMVNIQNESISAQIQILKNNVEMIFFMRDATFEGTGALNAFHKAIIDGVASLRGLIVEGEEGAHKLTSFGLAIQDVAIAGVETLVEFLTKAVKFMKYFSKEGMVNISLLKLYTVPLNIILKVLQTLGPEFTKFAITTHLLNKYFAIGNILSAIKGALWNKMVKDQIIAVGLQIKELVLGKALQKQKAHHIVTLKGEALVQWKAANAKRAATAATIELTFAERANTRGKEIGIAVSQFSIRTKLRSIKATMGQIKADIWATLVGWKKVAVDRAKAAIEWVLGLRKRLSVWWTNLDTKAKLKNAGATLIGAGALGVAAGAEAAFTVGTMAATAATWALYAALVAVGVGLVIGAVAIVILIIKKMAEMGNWMEKLKNMAIIMKVYFTDAVSGIMEVFSAWSSNMVGGEGSLMDSFTKFFMKAAMYLGAFIAVAAFYILGFVEKCIEVYKVIDSWLSVLGGVANIIGALLLITNPWLGALILIWKNWDKIEGAARATYEWTKKAADLAGSTSHKVQAGAGSAVGAGEGGLYDATVGAVGDATVGRVARWARGGQAGGYITPQKMQMGGWAQKTKPYLVGERGPELFNPGRSGQIINTDRTRSILGDMWGQTKDTAAGKISMRVRTLKVDNLITKTSVAGKTRLKVDTMAG